MRQLFETTAQAIYSVGRQAGGEPGAGQGVVAFSHVIWGLCWCDVSHRAHFRLSHNRLRTPFRNPVLEVCQTLGTEPEKTTTSVSAQGQPALTAQARPQDGEIFPFVDLGFSWDQPSLDQSMSHHESS